MTSEKLKPCPFCGGKAKIKFGSDIFGFEKYYGWCNCGTITKRCNKKEEAIAAWNWRADE